MVDTKHIDINFTHNSSEATNMEMHELVELLKAIGDEHRLGILKMLSDGEMCACEIHEPLCLPQNLSSHHLKALRETGLVNTRKEGRRIIYSLNAERFRAVSEMLNEIIKGGC